MNVSLTPQLEELVRRKVESGQYNSASEVVREGLRLIEERDRVLTAKLDALRSDIQVAVDQVKRGEGYRLNTDDELDAFSEQTWNEFLSQRKAQKKAS
ncbi:MAG: type II toxin-antitoxin system ParD family antitoxin [SAR202 cluster bacterium]|nr:type II toxin-antitoxin system ParD family antitoxin [SAR202 cluster bacterium]